MSRLTDCFALFYGPGEGEVVTVAAMVVPPDGCIVDAGAHIGATALPFSLLVPKGKVHAFEPDPEALEALRDNVAVSRIENIVVHPVGLSDSASEGVLTQMMAGNPGSRSFSGAATQQGADTLPLRRLDDELAAVGRIDFLKIDVEGFELRVLRGAERIIDSYAPAILFEVNEQALVRSGVSSSQVFGWLRARRYSLFSLAGGQLVPYDFARASRAGLHNAIAISEKQVAE